MSKPVVTIRIEGADRSGKSTIAGLIAAALQSHGIEVGYGIDFRGANTNALGSHLAYENAIRYAAWGSKLDPTRQSVKIVEVLADTQVGA